MTLLLIILIGQVLCGYTGEMGWECFTVLLGRDGNRERWCSGCLLCVCLRVCAHCDFEHTQQQWRMKCDGSIHRSLNANSICLCGLCAPALLPPAPSKDVNFSHFYTCLSSDSLFYLLRLFLVFWFSPVQLKSCLYTTHMYVCVSYSRLCNNVAVCYISWINTVIFKRADKVVKW